jgi:AcrR family transcriptional regulator
VELKTKDRILEAAYKCFSEKGYLGATTREIAKNAGVSEVTLFRHFKSKKELFSEVLDRFSVIPSLEKIGRFKAELSGVERVKFAGIEIIKSLQEKRNFLKILLSETPKLTSEVNEVYTKFSKKLFQILLNIFQTAFPHLPKKELELKVQIFKYTTFCFFLSNEIFQGKVLSEGEILSFVSELTDEILGGKS